jgi:hypothetical protein
VLYAETGDYQAAGWNIEALSIQQNYRAATINLQQLGQTLSLSVRNRR